MTVDWLRRSDIVFHALIIVLTAAGLVWITSHGEVSAGIDTPTVIEEPEAPIPSL